MQSEYTPDQLAIIQKLAKIQIEDLEELQRNPEILERRVEESRERGFDEVTISDYYEDILESWEIWERIAVNPGDFLVQRYFHNYDHLEFVLTNSFKPTKAERGAWQGLLAKLKLVKTLKNQN